MITEPDRQLLILLHLVASRPPGGNLPSVAVGQGVAITVERSKSHTHAQQEGEVRAKQLSANLAADKLPGGTSPTVPEAVPGQVLSRHPRSRLLLPGNYPGHCWSL